MLQTTDVKQKLWAEIEQLSPDELERICKLVVLVKDEFIDITGEDRYLTESWQQAEQEATEVYRQGSLEAYDRVDHMIDDILAESAE
jgi:fibrillarin-like rRNA methylase